MLETIIVVILILYLIGALAGTRIPNLPASAGGLLHILVVVVIVLLILRLLAVL